jgi:hypothetical protein
VQRIRDTFVPENIGTVTALPTSVDGEPLGAGDYFLVGADFTEGATTYLKGQIWEYTGAAWAISTDQSKAMSLLGDFADLDVDVESTVIGNAVIKKLVAIDAVIKTLLAQNITAGPGDGTAASGFRFRAMSDVNHAGGDNPVFDVFKDDKRLFSVDVSTGDVFIGKYSDGNGIKWDNVASKLYVKGSGEFSGYIQADSGIFKGIFDTTALKLEPGTLNSYTQSFANSNYQAGNIFDYYIDTVGLSRDIAYRASADFDASVYFIRFSSDGGYDYDPAWSGKQSWRSKTVEFLDSSYGNIDTITLFEVYSHPDWLYFSTYSSDLEQAVDITTYQGGDKLLVSSDIPTSATGLSDYQIWLDGDVLKVKLP